MLNNSMNSDSIKRTPSTPLQLVRPTEDAALLIDAENVALKHMNNIIAEAETLGKLRFRYVYGKPGNLATWNEVACQHLLKLEATVTASKHKNGSDIALVIGALVLFYCHDIRHFCIVASDSDYMPLIMYLRREGCEVVLIGNSNTPPLLQQACSKFMLIGHLLSSKIQATQASPVHEQPDAL